MVSLISVYSSDTLTLTQWMCLYVVHHCNYTTAH